MHNHYPKGGKMLSLISTFAQTSLDYSSQMYGTDIATKTQASSTGGAVGAAVFGFVMIFQIVIFLLLVIPAIIVNWKIVSKAGEPGWSSIVPVYNIIILNKIAGTPSWYVLLALIPGVSLIGIILIYIELSKKYSKPATIWLSILIPIVALFMIGKTEFIGGGASTATAAQVPGQGFAPQQPQTAAPVQEFAPQQAQQPVPQPQDSNNQQPPVGPQPPIVQ